MAFFIDFPGIRGPKYRVYDGDRLITPEGFPHPRQVQYFESDKPYTMFAGQRGNGKSFGAVYDNLFTAWRVPGSQQIIFRRTMGELRRTIINEFLKLPVEFRGQFTDSQVSPRLVLPDGKTMIHFASVNDEAAARKYLSGEFLKITFDEWAEIPYQWWSFITGSARSPITKDIHGTTISAQIKGLTNPGGVGADILRRLFGADCDKTCPKQLDILYDPDDYLFIPAVLDDNPAYAADTPAGRAYRKMLSNQPKAIREAWLHGRWTGFEGMYFDCFDKESVVIDHDLLLRMMQKQYWQPIFLGIDWGQVHYAAVNWNTLLTLPLTDGTQKTFVVTFAENMYKGLSERALAEEIVDMSKQILGEEKLARIRKVYLSPETFGTTIRSRARNIGDVFAGHGIIRPIPAKAEKHSRQNGLRHMYNLLSERLELLDGWAPQTSGWMISDRCPDLLSALPWAVSDPGSDGDIKKEGDSFQLDILDAIRYALYSHYVAADKPPEDQHREKMELISQGGIKPSNSLRLFVEHVKAMREANSKQATRLQKWASPRHPRLNSGPGRTDDAALVTGVS